jgi:copper(I)-binding protein
MIRSLAAAATLTTAMLAAAADPPVVARAGSLVIREAWSRATPAGARVGAGYAVIENEGGAPDSLVGVETEASERTELHETVIAEGIARMRSAGPLSIAAGARLELKPGGYHLMLTNLRQPLREGERFKGVLVFERTGRVPVVFVIRGLGAGAEHH